MIERTNTYRNKIAAEALFLTLICRFQLREDLCGHAQLFKGLYILHWSSLYPRRLVQSEPRIEGITRGKTRNRVYPVPPGNCRPAWPLFYVCKRKVNTSGFHKNTLTPPPTPRWFTANCCCPVIRIYWPASEADRSPQGERWWGGGSHDWLCIVCGPQCSNTHSAYVLYLYHYSHLNI